MKKLPAWFLRSPLKWPLYGQILFALLLAIIVGVSFSSTTEFFGISLLSITSYLGSLFLNALKMLIVPLIVSSIIVGMMELDGDALGRLGGKTLLYYLVTSFVAILTGLVLVNIIQPGLSSGEAARDSIGLAKTANEVIQNVSGHGVADVANVFLQMIPSNIVAAAADGQMLGLIFFSLLFGYFISKLKSSQATAQKQFWQGLLDIMMQMTELVMKFSPLGVFALVCKVILLSGMDAFVPLAWFFLTVILAPRSAYVCHAAVNSQTGGPRQPDTPFQSDDACVADGIFDQFVIGYAASDHGQRRNPCWCFQSRGGVHAAAGRYGQYGWYRPV